MDLGLRGRRAFVGGATSGLNYVVVLIIPPSTRTRQPVT